MQGTDTCARAVGPTVRDRKPSPTIHHTLLRHKRSQARLCTSIPKMQSLPDARSQSFEELYGPPENFLEIEVRTTQPVTASQPGSHCRVHRSATQ
jgi:hypothetical protein